MHICVSPKHLKALIESTVSEVIDSLSPDKIVALALALGIEVQDEVSTPIADIYLLPGNVSHIPFVRSVH